ncbi:metalloprotease [Ornithinimicrobium ciconiae]|uniref:Metalloprotease n=1 Tax=Ornithinimicrobium ciconiae TaxID=2594265 RepID=A0A516G9H7_9MICO|nr:M36 family metallopeptidase [Ornithinimicrobium ciconiae]QDO88178.1 metalloprotease [Ornithinimicrobium ciconiae]
MRRTPVLTACLALPLALSLLTPGASATPDPVEEGGDGASFFLTEPSSAAPEQVAMDVLRLKAGDYGVAAADLADLQVLSQHTSEHNGVTYVNLVQHHQGREVLGGVATVSVTKDGVVLHVAESLVPNLRKAGGTADLDAPDALDAAAGELNLAPQAARVTSTARGADQETVMTASRISGEEIPARLVWQPTEDGLRLAWELVIDEQGSDHLWQVMVDAESGETLDLQDWTDHHHASDFAGLARSPQAFDAAASRLLPASVANPDEFGTPTPVDDGSSYRVVAFPRESPNDGEHTLVSNPADSVGSPFGWHDTDGVPGAEFTITRGNNVSAGTDLDRNNQPDPGSQPDGGSSLTFDFDMDRSEHALNYKDAAVTNLFYANNVIHDVLYRYGFDEASGNFQMTNYTGEGTGGDPVRADAMDGAGVNNANFSTPARDGSAPAMQMYVWPGAQFGMPNGVTIGTGESAVTYDANFAFFTPAPTNAGLPGTPVVVEDSCSAFDAPGAIVVTARTNACSLNQQVSNAEAGGALAVVISHNEPMDPESPVPPRLSGSMATPVGIPAVSISQEDGVALRAQVADGATAASVHKISSHPGIRDGDYENGIIIHEYGHGVSNRLTGGLNINCLRGHEQMGEGWSDYLALTMLMDPAVDHPEEARGMGPYALFQDDRHGNGIRPRPYSRNMDIQPFTYDRIHTGGWLDGASLATPHGVGHAWAATLWDLNWDLIDKHGFSSNLYTDWDTAGNTRALQYVMDGLKMQGCEPGFVAGRDGILAASEALGGEDTCNVWAAFARRGLGYSAVQGTTNRDDNTEAFDVPPTCEAPGSGFQSPLSNTALTTVKAGSTTQIRFNLGGDLGADPLRAAHSPMVQEISCDTREPLQYSVTVAADGRNLSYAKGQQRYQLLWTPDTALAGTCQELILTLDDGTQHRADVRIVR